MPIARYPQGPDDYYVEAQAGNIGDVQIIHKWGRNDAVPNGSWAFVNQLGHTSWPLTAPTTVRVKAGNAADTAAGAGAREISVQGIDSAFAEVTEVIATTGTSASLATTTSFWRLHRAWVSSCGTYGGANTGDVVIENSAGGTDLIQITAGGGQSQFAAWSVPEGLELSISSLLITVDSKKSADIRLFTRGDFDVTTPPVKSKRQRRFFDGVSGDLLYSPKSPFLSVPARSDIWFEAYGDGAVVEVSVDFEIHLIPV